MEQVECLITQLARIIQAGVTPHQGAQLQESLGLTYTIIQLMRQSGRRSILALRLRVGINRLSLGASQQRIRQGAVWRGARSKMPGEFRRQATRSRQVL